MTEYWIPKARQKFNAYQWKGNISALNNPQFCLMTHDSYIAAKDVKGNHRIFPHEAWRFEKVK